MHYFAFLLLKVIRVIVEVYGYGSTTVKPKNITVVVTVVNPWLPQICLTFLFVALQSFNMSVPTINTLADGGMSHSLFTCASDKCIQGRCVVVNGVPACECKLGYMGDTCNETINKALSLPLTLGTLVFLIAFTTVIFLLAFIRQKQKAMQR